MTTPTSENQEPYPQPVMYNVSCDLEPAPATGTCRLTGMTYSAESIVELLTGDYRARFRLGKLLVDEREARLGWVDYSSRFCDLAESYAGEVAVDDIDSVLSDLRHETESVLFPRFAEIVTANMSAEWLVDTVWALQREKPVERGVLDTAFGRANVVLEKIVPEPPAPTLNELDAIAIRIAQLTQGLRERRDPPTVNAKQVAWLSTQPYPGGNNDEHTT